MGVRLVAQTTFVFCEGCGIIRDLEDINVNSNVGQGDFISSCHECEQNGPHEECSLETFQENDLINECSNTETGLVFCDNCKQLKASDGFSEGGSNVSVVPIVYYCSDCAIEEGRLFYIAYHGRLGYIIRIYVIAVIICKG